MANRVRWTDSIKKLEETDTTQIIEIGPRKGFVRFNFKNH
jgi:malonyl CoA-acyl carrier protein transacylase